MADMKGMGKAKGVDGKIAFSSKIKMGPNGAGISMGPRHPCHDDG